jgi:hypothetical protein
LLPARPAVRRILLGAECLLAASFAGLTLWVLYFVLINSAIEWPFEYREFAPVSFTGALLDGTNPYALESEPIYSNVYGPFYSLLVWPIAALTGNGFQVHRLVSLFFIGAVSVLLYALVRWGRGGRAIAACAGAVFCLAQVDDVSGLARSDGLGMFLFLAALGVLVRARSARPLTLASSSLLIALAFFTKPYFVLGSLIGAAFVLLRRGPSALLRYGAWGVGWFTFLAVAAHQLWPTLFINTVVLSSTSADYYREPAHLLSQASVFLRAQLGLVVALATVPFAWLAAHARGHPRIAPDALADDVVAIAVLGLAAGSAALVLVLGAHTGNGQLYYTQLILPFLLILVPPIARSSNVGRALVVVAFAYALVLRHDTTAVKIGGEPWLEIWPQLSWLSPATYQYGSPVFDVGEENRRSRARVRELISAESGEVFAAAESSALLLELRGTYFDNGLNQYCIYGLGGEGTLIRRVGGEGPLLRGYRNRCHGYWNEIFRRLHEREFARVLVTSDSRYLIAVRGHYRVAARLPIRLGYNRKELLVFEPLPR